jgi:hypothetical protein
MARDILRYGFMGGEFVTEFGEVSHVRDHSKLFTLLDQLDHFYGHAIYSKSIEQDFNGRATVKIEFDGDAWVEHEDRADRAERMLKWLVLKLSKEELRYLDIVPMTVAPESIEVETLIDRLSAQFDLFEKAHNRLRGKKEG